MRPEPSRRHIWSAKTLAFRKPGHVCSYLEGIVLHYAILDRNYSMSDTNRVSYEALPFFLF